MDMEFDATAAGLAAALSLLFIAMIWKIKTWDSIGIQGKIVITILLPIISYFVCLKMLDN